MQIPFWLTPIIEYFGRLALTYGLHWLEKKYPGSKKFLDMVLAWLEAQAKNGNTNAVATLAAHFDSLPANP